MKENERLNFINFILRKIKTGFKKLDSLESDFNQYSEKIQNEQDRVLENVKNGDGYSRR